MRDSSEIKEPEVTPVTFFSRMLLDWRQRQSISFHSYWHQNHVMTLLDSRCVQKQPLPPPNHHFFTYKKMAKFNWEAHFNSACHVLTNAIHSGRGGETSEDKAKPTSASLAIMEFGSRPEVPNQGKKMRDDANITTGNVSHFCLPPPTFHLSMHTLMYIFI